MTELDARSAPTTQGLGLEPRFCQSGVDPYSTVEWQRVDVIQKNRNTGEVIFDQRDVEFPTSWSMNAITIVTTKYFRGHHGTESREWSLKQLVNRVVDTYYAAGLKHNYFASQPEAVAFANDLKWLLVHQHFSFNSPVWFNVGTSSPAQVSACFILSVDDSMESILNWYTEEGFIFKGGSGAGINLSRIRSSKECLSTGGRASGPISFMRGADASAGSIKSGGATRRAAKMVVLNVDHPDIEEFIQTKAIEEDKIRILRDAGFDMDLGGSDIHSVQYQNANNSVRVTDQFMEAVRDDGEFGLRARITGEVVDTVQARYLFNKIAEAAWACADPGLQYHNTINRWHTNPETGPITASNPCFTGDTLVGVADGRNAVPIRDLVGTEPDVYACDEDGTLRIATMCHIRKTRENAEIWKVTLDDSSSFHATPDHRVRLRDGSYHEVKDLSAGTSLMPFDSKTITMGWGDTPRRMVRAGRAWDRQYWLIAGRKLYDYSHDGLTVDHTDGDSLNDAPDNLELVPMGENIARTMRGDKNPARRLMNDDWRRKLSEATRAENNPRYLNVENSLLVDVWTVAERRAVANGNQPHVEWNRHVTESGLTREVPLANGNGRIRGLEWNEFTSWIAEQAQVLETAPNHKVTSVEFAGYEDVYDGEVPGPHCFAVVTSVDGDTRSGTLSGFISSNCSEYLSLDNSSCNLASLNLLKFLGPDSTFDTDRFVDAVRLIITAMDISICFADFPTKAIAQTTRDYRQLGIGYSNLGALLMAMGLGYDSDGGRTMTAAITSLMTGTSYHQSARLATVKGAYEGYEPNAQAHMKVMGLHAQAHRQVAPLGEVDKEILTIGSREWSGALGLGSKHGFRNAQASVVAPTGTISFMLDCDTTGIEPDFSLTKYKKLVGGGDMEIVNGSVITALRALEYDEEKVEAIVDYVKEHGHVVDAPGLKTEHYGVFDCATGERALSPMSHVRMMAAAQPFVSGAISKTVNLPETATVEEIKDIYMRAWEMGIKALAVYRDNCKVGQPLSGKRKPQEIKDPDKDVPLAHPVRKRLPASRQSLTTSFSVGDAKGYMTAGHYDDGKVGEIFLKLGKQGSTLSGFMDAFAIAVSIGLQHGVPLETYVEKFTGMEFEPKGFTQDPDVRMAKSVFDYVFKRLALDHLSRDAREELNILTSGERKAILDGISVEDEDDEPMMPIVITTPASVRHVELKVCGRCGSQMRPSGSCHACPDCGNTSGCS